MAALFVTMAQNSSLGNWIFYILFFGLIWLVIKVVITRWIFRINEQIELLSQIQDELKKLNEGKV